MGETFEGKPEGNDRIKADKKSFDMRVKDFYNSLIPYVEQYGREMVREFFNYWSEPNKSKTLMRWETEYNKHRAFDIKRRLSTWKLKSEQYDRTKINRATSTQYTTKQESRNAAEELFFELLYGNKK